MGRKRNDGHYYTPQKQLETWMRRTRLTEAGCWEWTGPTRKTSDHVDVGFRGVVTLLHRAAYILFFGPIAEGLEIHHTCLNARCWRPDHLVTLTGPEHDELHRKRQRRTHCRRGHEFTPENCLPRTDGHGHSCRTCHRVNVAKAERRRQTDPERREKRQAWAKDYNREYKQGKRRSSA